MTPNTGVHANKPLVLEQRGEHISLCAYVCLGLGKNTITGGSGEGNEWLALQ